VIEIQAYKEGYTVLLQPTTIVPFQVKRFADTGRVRPDGAPWVADGREWHLQKRCSLKTREVFEKLDKILQGRFDVDGPESEVLRRLSREQLQLDCRHYDAECPAP
jgi:hypothetical protein